MGRGAHWEITYVGPPSAGKKSILTWIHKLNPEYSQDIGTMPLEPKGEFVTFWTRNRRREDLFIRAFSGDCEKKSGKLILPEWNMEEFYLVGESYLLLIVNSLEWMIISRH